MNGQRQIVGQSINADGNSRAFLWQNGVMTDLNTLIPADSNLTLIYANDINDSEEIVGQACVSSGGACTGDTPAFLLIPITHGVSGDSTGSTTIIPENIRQQLRPRTGVRH